MKKILIVILSFPLIFLIGCDDNKATYSKSNTVGANENQISNETEIFAMDTYMAIKAYGEKSEKAIEASKKTIERLDSLLSVGDNQSEIFKLNSYGKSKFSNESIFLLKKSIEFSKQTNNAFNPAVYPLMKLWGFTDENYKVPTVDKIKQCIEKTDISDIVFNESTSEVSFKQEDMGIDFGGIAKGYTSSKIMDTLKSFDIKSGVVSLGGNVQVLGTKPDGSLWNVAVQNPDDNSNYLGIIEVKNKAVITSGGYERYFDKDGKRYHHIIDPKTGYPSESDLKSVTIVSEDGTLADAYSTSLFVMGLSSSIKFWRDNSDKFDVILYTNDNKLYITQGLEKNFSSDLDFDIIEKEKNNEE